MIKGDQPVRGFRLLGAGPGGGFGGLRSDSGPLALLDGSPGSRWFWAVGATATYLGEDTVPGPPDVSGGAVSWVELYAVVGGKGG